MSREIHPLSSVQAEICKTQMDSRPGVSYNVGGLLTIKGALQVSHIQKSLDFLVTKHATLRTCLIRDSNGVGQFVCDSAQSEVELVDLRCEPQALEQLNLWAQKDFDIPIGLFDPQLYQFKCFIIADNQIVIYAKLHHIISDGWSFGLLCADLLATYFTSVNSTLAAPEVEMSYLDYVENERTYFASSKFEKDQRFWQTYLADLPDYCLAEKVSGTSASKHSYRLSAQRSCYIETLVAEQGVSLNTFFIALALLYLYGLKGHTDITVGQPIFNRINPRHRNITGQFTSDIALRIQIDPSATFVDLLKQVQRTLRRLYRHQRYPISMLQEQFELDKRNKSNFFEVFVNYYNTMRRTSVEGLNIEYQELYSDCRFHPLQLNIKKLDGEDGIDLVVLNHDEDSIHLSGGELAEYFNDMIDALRGHTESTQLSEIIRVLADKSRASGRC